MVKHPIAKKPAPKPGRRKKIIIICVSAFLAAVIILGTVLGIMIGVRNKRAVISCDGVSMDEGTSAFFLSYYKTRFLSSLRASGIEAYDTEDFWNSEFGTDTTYGEYYKTSAKKYLTEVCAAAALYDSLISLSRTDKENIKSVVDEVLDYKADGSREKFDELVAEYGFDCDDFENATKLLYKAQSVRGAAFGVNGERVEANYADYTNYISDYYGLYSRVKLLFIRTGDRFLLDADGKRVQDSSGNDTLVELSDSEKAERQSTIARIRTAIEAAKNGADGAMTSVMFDNFLSQHGEGDEDMNASGYYFFNEAEYTAEFAEEFPDIVEKAYTMRVGEYAEVSTDFGVCFIYKCERAGSAYADTSVGGCFSDFYSDVADYIFAAMVEELRLSAVMNEERFASLDALKIPANSSYVPKFG